jgi:RNA-binding protein
MLSNVAKQYLRGLGHQLDAIIQIGKEGATEGLVKATNSALHTHELVKVKVNQNAGEERAALITQLAQASRAEVVQTIGRTALLYRANPDEPKIVLPTTTQKLRRLKNKPKRG